MHIFFASNGGEIKHLGKDLSVSLLKGERSEGNRAAVTAPHLVLSPSAPTSFLQGRWVATTN